MIAHRLYSSHFFFSRRRRHTRFTRDWSSDVCSSDLWQLAVADGTHQDRNHHWPTLEVDLQPGERDELTERQHRSYSGSLRWDWDISPEHRSEERRAGKACRSRCWPYAELTTSSGPRR